MITSPTWYILGTGLSAQKYLSSSIYPVLGLNYAIQHPHIHAITSCDRHFPRKLHTQQWVDLGSNAHCLFTLSDHSLLPHATWWKFTHGTTPSPDRLITNAQNTGLSAINLCIYGLGAREIYLMGYDFDLSNKKWTHEPQVERTHRERILAAYTESAPIYREWGVQIYNTNPQSRLTCFPYKEIPHVEGSTPHSIDHPPRV